MPCQRVADDDDYHYGNGPHPRYDDGRYDTAVAAEGASNAAKAKYDPLLCSACRALERFGYDFDENPALSVWWANHKAEDARKAEAAKAEADRLAYRKAKAQEAMAKPLNQLTDEERNLLREEGFLK
jgi:hypothetical protein